MIITAKPTRFHIPAPADFWELSGEKITQIETTIQQGSPVLRWLENFGRRGWTEWTQGFQYGSAILQFRCVGEKSFLEAEEKRPSTFMAPHISHTGVPRHGFNNRQ